MSDEHTPAREHDPLYVDVSRLVARVRALVVTYPEMFVAPDAGTPFEHARHEILAAVPVLLGVFDRLSDVLAGVNGGAYTAALLDSYWKYYALLECVVRKPAEPLPDVLLPSSGAPVAR